MITSFSYIFSLYHGLYFNYELFDCVLSVTYLYTTFYTSKYTSVINQIQNLGPFLDLTLYVTPHLEQTIHLQF